MGLSATEPPPPKPSGTSRRRSSLFIAAFVGLQFLVPLTYLVREDASDERFTWRSFAADAAPECETHARVQHYDGAERELQLDAIVHRDWVSYVQQGRRAVVDAVLLQQCADDGVAKVELENRCEDEMDTRRYSLRCGAETAFEAPRTAAR